MIRRKTFLHLLCLLTDIFSTSTGTQSNGLPNELELVNVQNNGSVCHSCTHQVVVFHDFEKASFHPFSRTFPWADYKEKFPEVGFIFYFSGKDKAKLLKELKDLEFPFVGYYPEFQFYKLNRLDSINTKY